MEPLKVNDRVQVHFTSLRDGEVWADSTVETIDGNVVVVRHDQPVGGRTHTAVPLNDNGHTWRRLPALFS